MRWKPKPSRPAVPVAPARRRRRNPRAGPAADRGPAGSGQGGRRAQAGSGRREALLADLERLVDLVEGLDRAAGGGAPVVDVVESLRLLRTRMWPAQARLLKLATDPGLARRWRQIRQRINAISDRFDRPRVIVGRPGAVGTTAAVDRRLLAEADRAIVSLDDFLGPLSSSDATTVGSRFRDELGRVPAPTVPVPPAGGRGRAGRCRRPIGRRDRRLEPASRRARPAPSRGSTAGVSASTLAASPRPPRLWRSYDSLSIH